MLKLNVRDMSCGHRVATVQKAVRSADHAAQVDVDLKSASVTVQSQMLDDDAIISVTQEVGYPNEKIAV